MKIKFISFNYTQPFSINPIYYWLKSFYMKTGKHFDKYEWLKPEHVHKDDTLQKIVDEKPDILCLSIFIWNVDSIMSLAKEIKARLPNLIVIVGGPECDAHTNPEYFTKYPFIDYAVYGDGEKAFADLLDYFQDPTIDFSSIPNVVTREVKNKHQIFKFANYPAYNPYLDLKDEFLEDYMDLRKYVGFKWGVYLPYELARGCMYKCSFCDWHGGIHHKVNRRIHDWKADIDFFSENDIRAFQTDANTGIYQDDVEFYKYVAEKAKEVGPNKFLAVEPRNMAKLHKEKVAEIWHILASADAKPRFAVKAAIQSIYEDVLMKIDRPDVAWADHKKLLKEIKAAYPHNELTTEVIIGLPGMSIDRIRNTFLEFADVLHMPVDQVYSYEWMLLKKSPAASEQYRKAQNLQVTKTFYPTLFGGYIQDVDIRVEDFLKDPEIIIKKNQAFYIDMIYDADAGIEGVIYHKMLNTIFSRLIRVPGFTKARFEQFLAEHDSEVLQFSKEEAERQQGFFDKYGFYFWGHLDEESGLVRAIDFRLGKKVDELMK